jgi:hypothetical protein
MWVVRIANVLASEKWTLFDSCWLTFLENDMHYAGDCKCALYPLPHAYEYVGHTYSASGAQNIWKIFFFCVY